MQQKHEFSEKGRKELSVCVKGKYCEEFVDHRMNKNVWILRTKNKQHVFI